MFVLGIRSRDLGLGFGFAAGRISLCCVAIDGGGYEGCGEGAGGSFDAMSRSGYDDSGWGY